MAGIMVTIREILTLKDDENFFDNLDKMIAVQKEKGVSEKELDVLYTFMRKFISKKPTKNTLLIVNRIVNSLDRENKAKFMELYELLKLKATDSDLRKEIYWLLDYQNQHNVS